ncbi:MAG TPA: GNAT family N-acetyltransferase [Burkholderiales bacterium]|nr:GNAT family N-acetyltransferase [Burkholderiales bacterium]
MAAEQPERKDCPAFPLEAKLRDGTTVYVRPISGEDAEREQAFVRALSPQSRYFRFLSGIRELTPQAIDRFTHPDPAREIALVALTSLLPDAEQVGVARCAWRAQGEEAEFAIVVADAFQGKGLGWNLMTHLIACAKSRAVPRIWGLVLANNSRMLDLMRALGFRVEEADDPRLRRVVKELR